MVQFLVLMLSGFSPIQKFAEWCVDSWLSEEDVLALFVGRLTRDKGVLDLIRAFKKVSDDLPSLSLMLVAQMKKVKS